MDNSVQAATIENIFMGENPGTDPTIFVQKILYFYLKFKVSLPAGW
jgi:hypothetical protein